MPVHVFVAPSSPIKDRDIFATGIDYFPPMIQARIEKERFETFYWLNRIQDQKEALTILFEEIIDAIEFFGQCSESISKGDSPKKDPKYWMMISQRQKGFQTVSSLEVSAPKTYGYFKDIEHKFLTFMDSLATSISESTPTEFHSNRNLPFGFKIDETIDLFSNEKFSKIPLVQAITHLSAFMDIYLNAFRQINDDNILRQYPEEWKLHQANVSASGLALMLDKRFKNFERVDIFFYFPKQKVSLQFEGTIVDIRSIDSQFKERVAINFEFPDGNSQNFLQNEIQRYEIEECMSLEL